jgi:hypothetical protein
MNRLKHRSFLFETGTWMSRCSTSFLIGWIGVASLGAQSADWQSFVWREPQVRYLRADMTLDDKAGMYRDHAIRDRDPDSREAIRLWDEGSRVVNTNDFERRWVTNKFGKDGRVMRVVLRGTTRTITGQEVLLSSDYTLQQAPMRLVLAELTLGRQPSFDGAGKTNPSATEALRRWGQGARALNTNLFEWGGVKMKPQDVLQYRDSHQPVDGARVRLNTDLPYPETNVRYFMADIALGGSIGFYRAAAERDHEMGCLEAVRRTEEGLVIVNLNQFERKRVNGQMLITRKGSDARISGLDVRLSSD